MPVLLRAWMAVVMVVVIAAPQVLSLPQGHPTPLRNSPRALLYPQRPLNTQLAGLVEDFAQNDLEKGYMFDLDRTDSSDLNSPSVPKFNINTFTFNEKNVRKPGDIFSLLADVAGDTTIAPTETEQKTETTETHKQTSKQEETDLETETKQKSETFETYKQKKKSEETDVETETKQTTETTEPHKQTKKQEKTDVEGGTTTAQDTKQKTEKTATHKNPKPEEPLIKIPGIEVINTFGKKILMATKDFQDLMGTVQRMRKKVEAKLGNQSVPNTSPTTLGANMTNLVSLLLDPAQLEDIRTKGLTDKTEDEFLDHLTSVLIGGETRGTALTLDPVTIIALLTLAAYLIRAVYQVLTVTGSRSLQVADLTIPLHLDALPQAMASIHQWIAAPIDVTVREKRSVHSLVGNMLDIPGSLAAVIKLYREGHRSCVRPFICEQIQRRTFPDVTMTDMLIAALGYYFGEDTWASFIDTTLTGRSVGCDVLPQGCSGRTLDDAHYLENLYTRASYKFFDLLAYLTNLV